MAAHSTHLPSPDVLLVGSGVMSANLGALLKRLDPALSIQVYEATPELAHESSHGWNNAGIRVQAIKKTDGQAGSFTSVRR